MLDFTGRSYRALLEAMLNRVSSSLDKREGSMIQTALGAGAYALEEFYLDLDKVQRGGAIQTAVGEDLDNWAVIANVERYPASPAVRLGVFQPDIVPVGARFSTIDGGNSVNFTVTEKAGPGEYQLTCETPGTIGNSYTGPILPITAIQGLTRAELTDILVPGDDTETDGDLRERVISALRERPLAEMWPITSGWSGPSTAWGISRSTPPGTVGARSSCPSSARTGCPPPGSWWRQCRTPWTRPPTRAWATVPRPSEPRSP